MKFKLINGFMLQWIKQSPFTPMKALSTLIQSFALSILKTYYIHLMDKFIEFLEGMPSLQRLCNYLRPCETYFLQINLIF